MGIFSFLSRTEAWHICWIANIDGRDISYGDGTYRFPGGLRGSRIQELREKLAAETGEAAGVDMDPSQISITGLAKINM